MCPRYDAEYAKFRERVLARDNDTCQMPYCGCKHHLVVHHIKLYAKHPTVRTNEDNGITLCSKCHKSIRGKEKRYAAMFLKIIAERYET